MTNSIPSETPDNEASDYEKPELDGGGWISGPSITTHPTTEARRPIVIYAMEALQAFADNLKRSGAEVLLPYWYRYGELSAEQRAVILKLFPADPINETETESGS